MKRSQRFSTVTLSVVEQSPFQLRLGFLATLKGSKNDVMINAERRWTMTDRLRVLGVFYPTRFVWRPFGEFLEIDRCRLDGRLVTNRSASIQRHVGHSMVQPVLISFFELILIWLRMVR